MSAKIVTIATFRQCEDKDSQDADESWGLATTFDVDRLVADGNGHFAKIVVSLAQNSVLFLILTCEEFGFLVFSYRNSEIFLEIAYKFC